MILPDNLLQRAEECGYLSPTDFEVLVDACLKESYKQTSNKYNPNATYVHQLCLWDKSRMGFSFWKKMSDLIDGFPTQPKIIVRTNNFDMKLSTQLTYDILKSKQLNQYTKYRAVTYIRKMVQEPLLYKVNNDADDYINLFNFDLALGGQDFWEEILLTLKLEFNHGKKKENSNVDSSNNTIIATR